MRRCEEMREIIVSMVPLAVIEGYEGSNKRRERTMVLRALLLLLGAHAAAASFAVLNQLQSNVGSLAGGSYLALVR